MSSNVTVTQTLWDDLVITRTAPSEAEGSPKGAGPEARLKAGAAIWKARKTPDGGKMFRAIANSGLPDRDGEIIDPKGWVVPDVMPKLLYGHNYGHDGQLPVGRLTQTLRSKSKGFVIESEIASDTSYPLAQWVAEMVPKYLNQLSVGFMPITWTNPDGSKGDARKGDYWGAPLPGRTYTKQELFEVSIVPVPSDANSQMLMAGMKSLRTPDGRGLLEAALEPQVASAGSPLAAKDAETSPLCFCIKGRAEIQTLMAMALRGYPDMKAVYEHLAGHYADFPDKITPPEFRAYTELELKFIERWGRVPYTRP